MNTKIIFKVFIILLWCGVLVLAVVIFDKLRSGQEDFDDDENLTCLSGMKDDFESGWFLENITVIFNGCTARLEETTVRTNSFGLRDREYEIIKPEGTKRVIALGDSVTFGWGVELEDSWVKQLELLLNKKSNFNYEVMNFGVPGLGTREEARLLKEKAMQFDPDIIIITVIPNDWEDNYTKPLSDEYYAFLVEDFCGSNMNCTINEKQGLLFYHKTQNYMRDELTNITWGSMETGFYEIYNLTNPGNRSIVLGHYPFNQVWSEKLFSLARKLNWELVDLTKFYYEEKYRLRGSRDPHPNKQAHKEIAREYYDALLTTNKI